MYTADVSYLDHTNLTTFVDDASFNTNIDIATNNLKTHLNKSHIWFNTLKIKINKNKSSHITFTLRPQNSSPLTFNNKIIYIQNSIKYLIPH